MKKTVKKLKHISIVIDTWDDIFSDFDPSPLNERTLSEDFLIELQKRYKTNKKGQFEITILAPKTLQKDDAGKKVVGRLKKHFRTLTKQRIDDINKSKLKGGYFIIFGIIFLAIITILNYFKMYSDILVETIGIIFIPIGWFGIWEGFGKIVDPSPILMSEEKFYKKMADATYQFQFVGNIT